MFKRTMLFALVSIIVLCLGGCGGAEPTQQASQPAEAPPPPKPKEEPPATIYELTKDDITSHADWTSRNISILGVKLGDRTRDVEKNLGAVNNTRTLPEDYLTVYQDNGLFIYTFKITGRARKMEATEVFAKRIADAKLKKLLTGGDLKYMRELFGMEENVRENPEDNATEYAYDSRGFSFVQFKVGNSTINALRFVDLKKTT
jgi:hypothetical protein